MITLTTKELNGVAEQINAEQLLVKRCHHASDSCTDPALKQQFCQIAERHQQHYNTLVNFLK